jgi:membrane protein DedA with SNARE-associated domain
MAGFAAYRGYLDLEKVILIALFAGFLGDQLYFFLGRRHGRDILTRFPTLKPRVERVDTLLRRYHLLLIPGIRFMYGLRIVGPIAFGMGRVEAVRFSFPQFYWCYALGAAHRWCRVSLWRGLGIVTPRYSSGHLTKGTLLYVSNRNSLIFNTLKLLDFNNACEI